MSTNSFESLKELTEQFRHNLAQYKSAEYDESNTRTDFIDKFFEILGWDVRNTHGYSEDYRDVIREDRVKIDNRPKAPDYAFRIGRERKFFVEAKKPSVNIHDEIAPAFQLRRYGYTAKLPLSILTDFEEFAVYDTRIKPHKNDKASVARVFYCKFTDYLETSFVDGYATNFDYICNIFSKESVLKGSFDRYAESTRNKRGTSEVDQDLLALIEQWRLTLAKNIAKQNPQLDTFHLNLVVQRIIDRILFLRIAEDRHIERYEDLFRAAKKKGVYRELLKLFVKADDKYNAGIFKHEDWFNKIIVPDKVLTEIVTNLYYPDSPYAFSELPIEILGSIYERFLGKTIRLTASHNATVEEKPEVRKSSGVYYTPQYIVDYIVQETVGHQLNNAATNQNQLRQNQLKQNNVPTILDPACGSGSFLVGAYTFLLDYYLSYYCNEANLNKSLKTGLIYEVSHKTYRLSIDEKQRILLNGIFGVDIDPIAVEVTKLSLYLKLLENETDESQPSLFSHKYLPDLDKNIRCGNSLIESDFYTDKQLSLFDDTAMRKINAFDWQKEFPHIFKNSGFDCVIGNPPYVRQETLEIETKKYFQTHYKTYHGNADLYTYFFEKGIGLLNATGLFSIVVANKWTRASYGKKLRNWLKNHNIQEIVDFNDLPVFGKVTSYPMIIRIGKCESCSEKSDKPLHFARVTTLDFESVSKHVMGRFQSVPRESLTDNGWQLGDEGNKKLFDKLMSAGIPLKKYVKGKIYRGVVTGLNKAFVINAATRKRLIKEDKRSAKIIKPFLTGRDVKCYAPLKTNKFVIFTQHGIEIDNYPAVKKYLEQFHRQLTPKPKNWVSKNNKHWKGRKSGSYQWYEIQDAVDYYKKFEQEKIIIPAIVNQAHYTIDSKGFYCNDKTTIISIGDKYLLALLNSRVCDFVLKQIAATKRGGYFEYKPMYLSRLPIHQIDVKNKSETKIHDCLVNLVDQMLSVQEKLNTKISEPDRKLQEQRVLILDREIDTLVYKLYGLNCDDIEIIEKCKD
ncbi:MAG: Eco57I restriction-modification methylase domain-containing protein [Planctomycetaceae bacterium]|nr:Eco57I restriction-modification methylase domain-containing protein [Planctomycetaceae bacterium]